MYCTPGALNSILISTENAVPTKPENKANIKYKVPISLALEDQNHLSKNIEAELIFYLKLDILNKPSVFGLFQKLKLFLY